MSDFRPARRNEQRRFSKTCVRMAWQKNRGKESESSRLLTDFANNCCCFNWFFMILKNKTQNSRRTDKNPSGLLSSGAGKQTPCHADFPYSFGKHIDFARKVCYNTLHGYSHGPCSAGQAYDRDFPGCRVTVTRLLWERVTAS